MITTGHIDTKHQYGLKRKDFRHRDYAAVGSLHSDKQYNSIQHNIATEPLQGSAYAQVSFKGFNFGNITNALKPVVKTVPDNLKQKVFHSLKHISSEQYGKYIEIKDRFINYVIDPNNASFRKQNGISDALLKELKEANGEKLIYLPKKTVASKFVNQLITPFTALYRWGEKLLLPKNSPILLKRKERQQILKDYAALEGLIKSHEIWENGYRKMAGLPKLSEKSNFIIPDDVLYSKINRRRNKVVDPNKGKYSSNSLMIGNRLISGIVYSYFLGTDAYNTTMRYSNDRHEASNQRTSRIAQEFSRIGLNMYIQNLLFGTFETAVNRSLPTAMFVSGSTVAFSEILGRKLVGKPIMPSDKEKLDKLEKEMYEKKGILPSIGRLLTTVKKRESKLQTYSNTKNSTGFNKTKANNVVFSAFAQKKSQHADTPLKSQSQIAFKGGLDGKVLKKFFVVDKLINREKISNLYKIINEADAQTAENIKNKIMMSARKSEYFDKIKAQRPSTFEELILSKYEQIPVGKKETIWGKIVTSVMLPVKFLINITKSIGKLFKRTFYAITGKKNNELLNEYNKLKNSENPSDIKKLAKFNDFYENRLKLEAWARSPYSDEKKLLKIFAEFKSIKGKDKEDIAGVKNILLWLDKQLAKEGIQIKEDGTLSEYDKKRVREILMESVKRADGEKQLEYDGNTLAQTNINLSRAITTLFLVTDAYNLTMQYSNDNRKDANKSAKNRAAQEISRISVSAYIMAFVHNLLSKLCNSSLAGAFTLTALTSSINDSISREVVGVPLTAKSQEELEAIDKKNAGSKNPIKKALAYSIGKRSVANAMKVTDKTASPVASDTDYLSNDFFIIPEIS